MRTQEYIAVAVLVAMVALAAWFEVSKDKERDLARAAPPAEQTAK
jgi:hypothetical protein